MLGTLEVEEAAQEAADNWRRFKCFVWFRDREVEDADQWAIIYTHNRDSGLLDQSNSAFIAKAMEPFTEGDDPDVVFESHSHWAVGHVDGFSLRVLDRTYAAFTFDLHGFFKESGVVVDKSFLASHHLENSTPPYLAVEGTYCDVPFLMQLQLEPHPNSEPFENIDMLKQELRDKE